MLSGYFYLVVVVSIILSCSTQTSSPIKLCRTPVFQWSCTNGRCNKYAVIIFTMKTNSVSQYTVVWNALNSEWKKKLSQKYTVIALRIQCESTVSRICEYLCHTGLICFRSFQNYAFKRWLSLETMKLWLLVLTKPLFLKTLIIKLTLGNIFIKVKNPPGGATVTK